MTNALLIALGLGVTVVALLIYFIVLAVVEQRRRVWEDRARYPADAGDSMVVKTPRPQATNWDEQVDAGFESLVAGSRVGIPPEKVLAFICLFATIIGWTLFLWRGQFWIALGGGLLALVLPVVVLALYRGRAKAELQEQLPDVLFMLARSVRAGLNLEQAIQLIVEQDLQPLADEFKPVLAHLKLGLPLPKALAKVADKVKLLDFYAFVSVVSFYRANGGNLGLLLDRLAQSVRDRNQFRGHLWSTTAQARFTALLVGLVGPLLLVGYAVFQPAHVLPFFQSFWGWIILLGALTVEIIAATSMYQILRVDY